MSSFTSCPKCSEKMETGKMVGGNVLKWDNKKCREYTLRNFTGWASLHAKRCIKCKLVIAEYD